MTAKKAHEITTKSNVLEQYLFDVYNKVAEVANNGNYELLFSGRPINISYADWNMYRENPNIKEDFIADLKRNGYKIVNNSDKQSNHRTIIIRWKDIS